MQTIIGTIEMETFFVFAVVSDDIKAAGHGDEELMAFLQSMASAISATGNVVEVKNALNLEWNMTIPFQKREIAARVVDFGQLDDSTLV